MSGEDPLERRAARAIAALAAGKVRLAPDGSGRHALTAQGEAAPRMVLPSDAVEEMCRRGWLRRASDNACTPTPEGRAWLARRLRPDDPYRAQHLAMIEDRADDGAMVTVVANESPLAWLARRRGPDGRPIVAPAQFAAGERLRADVERARMMPRVTADWTGTPMARGRRGPARDPAAALDAVVAARANVERALDAVGADLASLLLDVCCFLTSLADAERRRSWPRRSGKVVLRIALDRLAEHYGIGGEARGPDSARRIVHWGGEDYRPGM